MTIPVRFAIVLICCSVWLLPFVSSHADELPLKDGETRLFLANADGSEMKRLTDLPEFTFQGSPCWSRDGKLIAFDGWQMGQTTVDGRVFVINSDGANLRNLCDGLMPSFSPGAQRIAFSRSSPNHGVWIMSTDGPERELVQLDDQGWSAHWSPDGKKIAYVLHTGGGANLAVFSLVEGVRQMLFDEGQESYQSVHWNFAWSPDSRQIVFKGAKSDGQTEVAIVDARGAKHGLVTRLKHNVKENFAWHPDGSRILINFLNPTGIKLTQLYWLDPRTQDPPQLLSGQDTLLSHEGMTYSPDGTRLALSSKAQAGWELHRERLDLQAAGMEMASRGKLGEALDALAKLQGSANSRMGKVSLIPVWTRVASRLSTLPAAERYALLRDWTLPPNELQSVRSISMFVPSIQGPPAFGPSGGEAVSTLCMLVESARESGQLPELIAAVSSRSPARTPRASVLLQLANIAAGETDAVASHLAARVQALKSAPVASAATKTNGVEMTDFLVTRAALRSTALSAAAEPLAHGPIKRARAVSQTIMLAHLRSELAQATVARESGLATQPTGDPGLALWRPAIHQAAENLELFPMPAWWSANGRYITHRGGPMHELLYFAWPLEGEFEFGMDTYRAEWCAGNLGYAGQIFEGAHRIDAQAIWPIGKHASKQLQHPFMRLEDFNRVAVRVASDGVHYRVNGRLIHSETNPSPTSPWLCLHGRQSLHAVFRNLSLTGQPRIPRSVKLTHGDRLDGWISSFYNETQPSRPPYSGLIPQPLGADAFDWTAEDGVIRGHRFPGGRGKESRLYYHRPLASGETLRYEFHYQPGKTIAHPAIDRLAFLLEPDGVRMHWMTDGTPHDLSGLPVDHAWDEPEHRRGPAALPLKENDWNEMSVTLNGDRIVLALNGEAICNRPLPEANDRLFGLFHFKDLTAVEVRNVVLTGNWPEALTEKHLANLAALDRTQELSSDERRQRTLLIGEQFIAREAEEVAQQASGLSPAERYEQLSKWVLPSYDHVGFRLYGYFTPTNPAPIAATKSLLATAGGEQRRTNVGGWLAAPAIDLVATAAELGKLDDLKTRVTSVTVASPIERRAQLALLALVHEKSKDNAQALAALRELKATANVVTADTPDYQVWPDMIAFWGVISRPFLRAAAMQNLTALNQRVVAGGVIGDVEKAFVTLRAMATVLTNQPGDARLFGADPGLANWQVVTQGTAASRGGGRSRAHWRTVAEENRLMHVAGHGEDWVYFSLPMRGDFVFECDMTARGTRIGYGGLFVGLRPPNLKQFDLIAGLRSPTSSTLETSLQKLGESVHVRLESAGGQVSYTVDGRRIHQQTLAADHDPWLMIRQEVHRSGGVWNVQLTGKPDIPESVPLSAATDLSGWLSEYYAEVTSSPAMQRPNGTIIPGKRGAWGQHQAEIMGYSAATNNDPVAFAMPGGEVVYSQSTPPVIIANSHQESILQYHRPLLEDGVLEYEFYYEPGKTMVHPAVDRLTFMLEPAGVNIHWLTDAQYERTGLAPDNLHEEPENRRGSAKVPLKPRQWNQLKLTLKGDDVQLLLNGVDIYQRALEPTNQRTFGLFHYADQTEVRVRNVSWKGNWPREMPTPESLFAKAAQ